MNEFEALKTVFDESSVYYLIFVNMNSQYSYLNKRYQDAFKGRHGDLIGKHYSTTIHKDDLEVCKTVSLKCFEQPNKAFPATIRKHDGNGGYIITQWEYKALFDEDNNPLGIFCIGNDITEFIKTRSHLEQTMASLTNANDVLKEIAHMQSHVVRKPIANILGLSTILEAMEVNESVRDVVTMINSSAKELDDIITSVSKKI